VSQGIKFRGKKCSKCFHVLRRSFFLILVAPPEMSERIFCPKTAENSWKHEKTEGKRWKQVKTDGKKRWKLEKRGENSWKMGGSPRKQVKTAEYRWRLNIMDRTETFHFWSSQKLYEWFAEGFWAKCLTFRSLRHPLHLIFKSLKLWCKQSEQFGDRKSTDLIRICRNPGAWFWKSFSEKTTSPAYLQRDLRLKMPQRQQNWS